MSDSNAIEVMMAKANRMKALMDSPAWEEISAELRESLQQYDTNFHQHRCDDVVGMQMLQTSCHVIKHVLETPARLYDQYQHALTNTTEEENA